MSRIRVGIIGTAGRGEAKERLNATLFQNMYRTIEEYLGKISPWNNIRLVSGGSSWSDHLAVKLYLNHPECELELHLPCKLEDNKFLDTGTYDWRSNPGRTLNSYHRHFSNVINSDTIGEIKMAEARGASLKIHPGFHARNLEVGRVGILIAFTFSTSGRPNDGGTLHTWKNSPASHKVHCSLAS